MLKDSAAKCYETIRVIAEPEITTYAFGLQVADQPITDHATLASLVSMQQQHNMAPMPQQHNLSRSMLSDAHLAQLGFFMDPLPDAVDSSNLTVRSFSSLLRLVNFVL